MTETVKIRYQGEIYTVNDGSGPLPRPLKDAWFEYTSNAMSNKTTKKDFINKAKGGKIDGIEVLSQSEELKEK